MAKYVNDPSYIADDYIASGYVGTNSDAYVESGYVVGIQSGEANITSTATMSVDAGSATDIARPISLTSTSTQTTNGVRIREGKIPGGFLHPDLSIQVEGQTRVASAQFVVTSNAVRIREATANLSALADSGGVIIPTATMSVDAKRTRNSSASLLANVGGTSWQNMNTWQNPTQERWKGFSVEGIFAKIGKANLTITANVVVNGRTDIDSDAINIASTTAQSTDGIRTRNTSSSITTTNTLVVDGVRTRQGIVLKASAGAISVDGVRTRNTSASITSQPAILVVGERTVGGIVLKASQAQLSATGIVVTFGSATLTSTSSVLARTAIQGTANLNVTNTLTSQAGGTRNSTPITSDSTAALTGTGGMIRGMDETFTAFNTVLSAMTIYIIDPFRVYHVDSESRTLVIAAESRNFSINRENRVNSVIEENRSYAIDSETRQLVVQNLKLKEVIGNPLDKRE